MKANTTQHVKFKRLCRKLGITRWEAIGLLESLWHLTASSAPAGDIGKHSNEDIAALIEWNADEDQMIDALVVCGWLDEHPEHRLVVHDWHDHCPTYIKGNLSRSGKEFATKAAIQLGTKEGDSQLGTKEPTSSTCPEVNTTKPSQAKSGAVPNCQPADSEDEQRSGAIAAVGRMMGRELSIGHMQALDTWAASYPPAIGLDGRDVPRWELIDLAAASAIKAGASPRSVSGATKYMGTVIEHCIRDGRMPDERPGSAREKPRDGSTPFVPSRVKPGLRSDA